MTYSNEVNFICNPQRDKLFPDLLFIIIPREAIARLNITEQTILKVKLKRDIQPREAY